MTYSNEKKGRRLDFKRYVFTNTNQVQKYNLTIFVFN
jgi:hypothetical protein